ncbi:MAG: M28 family peptidase [Bacteroidales bacterium]|nr:M28 family peptidase [Bacteroidales bacterium]
MMRLIFALSFLLFRFIYYSQDVTYAQWVVKKLCSDPMRGRGYTNAEIDSAAYFIAGEFKRFDIRPLHKDYFQNVTYEVNFFPKAKLILNKQDTLIPAHEFNVSALSSNQKGTFKTWVYNPKDTIFKLPRRARNRFVIIPAYQLNDEKKKKLRTSWGNLLQHCEGILVMDTNYFIAHIVQYEPSFAHPLLQLSPTIVKKWINNEKKLKYVTIDLVSSRINYTAKNIMGYVQGREFADSLILIVAHYDHLGKLDTAAYPGANDNASGVAMMLDIARTIKENMFRPRYSMGFVAFAGEEAGLKGSIKFVQDPPIPLSQIKFVINLDMVGTGSQGIGVVNGTTFSNYAKILTELNEKYQYVPNIQLRGESFNSDHAPFAKKGIPSFFIYTMGGEHPFYHQVQDKPPLPFTKYEQVFKLLIDFIYSL